MNEYQKRIARMVDYIENHLNLSLISGEVARITNFSSFHFFRIFKAIVGSFDVPQNEIQVSANA